MKLLKFKVLSEKTKLLCHCAVMCKGPGSSL